MKLVVIESPFKASCNHAQQDHVRYAREAMRDAILNHDEAPIASHLLYPQCLDDSNDAERKLGMALGILWGAHAERACFYIDYGWSEGMKAALAKWQQHPTIEIVERKLPPEIAFNVRIEP